MFTKMAESKWMKFVLFITVFAFVGTAVVALFVYKLTGQMTGVAEVNGKEITMQEFNYNVNLLLRSYEEQGMDTAAIRKMVYSQALDNLINQELLYQEAQKEGLEATEEEIKKAILEIPAFQENGKFSKDRYFAVLSSIGISPEFFEKLMKKDITVKHLMTILKSNLYLTKDEINTFIGKQLTKITGEALVITPSNINISEKEIKEYYEKNKEEFAGKEGKKIVIYQVKINKENPSESEKTAKETFLALKKNQKVPEKAGLSKAFEGVMYKKEDLKNLPKEVQEEAKKLSGEKNLIFVKTKEAYYLGKYLGKYAQPLPLESVKDQIMKLLKQEKQKKQIEELYKKVKEAVKNEKDINKLAKEFKGKLEKIKNKTIQEVAVKYGVDPRDVKYIYLTKENAISEPVKFRNGILIVKVEKKTAPDPKKYKEMEKSVVPLMEGQKFTSKLNMYIDKLRKESDIRINKRVLQ